MKYSRLITAATCTIPMALGTMAIAQTTPPPATEAPAQTTPGTPGTTGTPGTPGTPDTPGTPGSPMGTTPPSPMDSEMTGPDTGQGTETLRGWSVKNSVMGESIYNENDEKVGDVNDVVLTSDGQVTHLIVGAGGFLGMGQHDVAIPFDEVQRGADRLTLSGYTKDQLKALPRVELAE